MFHMLAVPFVRTGKMEYDVQSGRCFICRMSALSESETEIFYSTIDYIK